MRLALLNVFRLCRFLRALGHVMVFVVLGLIGVQYYSVVVVTLGPGMSSSNTLKATMTGILAGLFTILVFLILWSYFSTVLTNAGMVPENWHPFIDEAMAATELQRWMQYGDLWHNHVDPRRPRYCRKCCVWKPERTHHCSISRRCILKMDHYCIWVVNCVGLLNYKFFLLFLMYTWTGCLTSMCIQIPSIIQVFSDDKPNGYKEIFLWRLRIGLCLFRSTILVLSFFLNVAFIVSLFAFISMHLHLLSTNCTSIEMYEKQRMSPWPYDMGVWNNIKGVFGNSLWMALLPFYTETERERILNSVLSPGLFSPAPQLEAIV